MRLGPILLACYSVLGADKLAIDRLALHQFEDGPVLPLSHEFLPGETVYMSCRIKGYRLQKVDEEDHMKLVWRMRVTDPAGVLIEKEKSGHVEARVLPQDKDWVPKFIDSFVVPPFAPTGTYKVAVNVKDEPDGAAIDSQLEFHVRGYTIEPSETLLARNIRFLRDENDQAPLRNPAYPQGAALWVRFEITGYKFAEKNRYDVEYGLAILGPSGDPMFSQPVAAKESSESFYPQRYVPGLLSLSLDKNVAKGPYTLVVTIRDNAGHQTWESRQIFQVE